MYSRSISCGGTTAGSLYTTGAAFPSCAACGLTPHRRNIWQLALLIAPAMALLRHNSHSPGQIVLLAGILLSLLFYVVLMRLFRRKRDESLSYEECLATTSALALVETILLGSFTAGILIYHTLKILLR